MAAGSAIKAGRAVVEIFSDTTRLERGLTGASRKLGKFSAGAARMGGAIMGAGSAMAAPFAVSVGMFMKEGDKLGKMAARTGVSVESLSQIDFAAGQSGSSLETFERAIRRMQATIGDESADTKVFDQYGISIANLKGLDPEKQFLAIADAVSAITDPTIAAAAANRLFGRSGTELIPMMSKGAQGIRDYMQEADRLGLTMSTTDAQAAERLTDAMDVVGRTIKRAAVSVGASLSPTLENLSGIIGTGTAKLSGWINENRGMIVGAASLAAGLIVTGGTILGIGLVAKVAAIGIGLASTAVGILGTTIGLVASPLGAAVLLIGGIGYLAAKQFGLTEVASQKLGKVFGTVKDDALTAFGGIKAALASGDFGAAAEIAGAMIELQWTRASGAVLEVWENVKAGLSSVWDGLADSWQQFTNFLGNSMDLAVDRIIEGFDRVRDAALVATIRQAHGDQVANMMETGKAIARGHAQGSNTAERDLRRQTRESELDGLRSRVQQTQQGFASNTVEKMKAAQERVDKAKAKLGSLSSASVEKEKVAKAARAAAANEPASTSSPNKFAGLTGTTQTGVAGRLAYSSLVSAGQDDNPVPLLGQIKTEMERTTSAVTALAAGGYE
jgi:hypothetical protein